MAAVDSMSDSMRSKALRTCTALANSFIFRNVTALAISSSLARLWNGELLTFSTHQSQPSANEASMTAVGGGQGKKEAVGTVRTLRAAPPVSTGTDMATTYLAK